jgi:copper chaperone CopZ
LEPLPGLADLAIDPETKEVRVSLDENQTLVSQVIDRIRQAGFDVEEH